MCYQFKEIMIIHNKLIFSVQHVNTDILQSLQDLVVLHQILVFILILKYLDCVFTHPGFFDILYFTLI